MENFIEMEINQLLLKEIKRNGGRMESVSIDSVSLAPAIMDSDTGQYEYWRDGQHLQELEYIQFPDGRIGCRSPIRN